MGKLIVEEITVRQLINLLLDEPMDNLIVIRKDGKQLHNLTINSKEPEGLGALFG